MSLIDAVLSLFSQFWERIERPSIWRVSLFYYEKLDKPPYFTYYRGTWWLDYEPRNIDLLRLSGELYEQIPSENIRESPMVEVEQFLPGDGATLPVGSFRLSRSEGSLPREDYVGLGQSQLDDFSNSDLEG